jgi:hydroxymethylpyrimidine pyrophosphatase-like HAD family hydrolase
MIIAVDFDGTIVEHKYPAIGKELLFAFETLRELQKQGHIIILWTYRTGKELEDAVTFCREKGIEFYAVNKSYPEEVFDENTASRKINADVYIDDRNIGGFLGWSKIWQLLNENSEEIQLQRLKENSIAKSKQPILDKIKGIFR